MTWLSGKDEKTSFDTSIDSDSESVSIHSTPSFTRNDILLCATHGKIYAIHKHTGARLWRASYPTGAMGGVVSIFITDQDRVIVGANGKTACMDLLTGAEKWVNKMKGCGYEEVGVICTPSRVLKPQRTTERSHEPLENAPPEYCESNGHGVLTEQPVAISCTRGKCMGIDIETGEELWKFNCPNGGFKIPSALVDPEGESTTVFVGCGRRLYCLDAATGELKWEVKVSNSKVGLGYMTMATPWSSRLAAEAHTAFSQFPSAQQRNEIRNRERGSGGGGGGGGGG
ncbi:quinon protein alcohol dehydrogenase-like superfamily [Zychaea mexicana]|uniref:quinon protein alcohol dehydrogenase-like superfamily n=1 Tax=Zychaea mexicana TaxID=64656 RepID=UPI0022FE3CDF|nr:quinon protein alcohol dehydrogenase-like superfamily [Zychaea mexicana]KAI9496579.1 quinon protein alcohol dehydrogenase-like superfamily [Zychaea mexicana]